MSILWESSMCFLKDLVTVVLEYFLIWFSSVGKETEHINGRCQITDKTDKDSGFQVIMVIAKINDKGVSSAFQRKFSWKKIRTHKTRAILCFMWIWSKRIKDYLLWSKREILSTYSENVLFLHDDQIENSDILVYILTDVEVIGDEEVYELYLEIINKGEQNNYKIWNLQERRLVSKENRAMTLRLLLRNIDSTSSPPYFC